MGLPSNQDGVELYSSIAKDGSAPMSVTSHEPFLQAVADRGFNPEHILDVGANVGTWSRLANQVFPRARLTLVEPQEHLAAELERLVAQFPSGKLLRVGAGSAFEQRELSVRPEDPSSTFCDVGDYDEPIRLQPTTIIPLDSLLDDPEFVQPSLVKIDTEGFEMQVFGGAAKVIAGAEMIIVEVSLYQWYPMTPRFADIVGFLDQRGFEVYDFPWFIRRPLDGALGIVDICFVRHDSPLRSTHRWV